MGNALLFVRSVADMPLVSGLPVMASLQPTTRDIVILVGFLVGMVVLGVFMTLRYACEKTWAGTPAWITGMAVIALLPCLSEFPNRVLTSQHVAKLCKGIDAASPLKRKEKRAELQRDLKEREVDEIDTELRGFDKVINEKVDAAIRNEATTLMGTLGDADYAQREKAAKELAARVAKALDDGRYSETAVYRLCSNILGVSGAPVVAKAPTPRPTTVTEVAKAPTPRPTTATQVSEAPAARAPVAADEQKRLREATTRQVLHDFRFRAGRVLKTAWADPKMTSPDAALVTMTTQATRIASDMAEKRPEHRDALLAEAEALLLHYRKEADRLRRPLKGLAEIGGSSEDAARATGAATDRDMARRDRQARRKIEAIRSIWPGCEGHPLVGEWVQALASPERQALERSVALREHCAWPLEGGLRWALHPVARFLVYFVVAGCLLYIAVHAAGNVVVTVACSIVLCCLSIPLWYATNTHYPALMVASSDSGVAKLLLGAVVFVGSVGSMPGLLWIGSTLLLVVTRDEWPEVHYRFEHAGSLTAVGYQCPKCGHSESRYFGVCPRCGTRFGGTTERLSGEEIERRRRRVEEYRQRYPNCRRVLLPHFLASGLAMVCLLHGPFLLAKGPGNVAVAICAVFFTIVLGSLAVVSSSIRDRNVTATVIIPD